MNSRLPDWLLVVGVRGRAGGGGHRGRGEVPGRWVDWENRLPTPARASIAWREQNDHLHTGARAVLERLTKDAHTESYDGPSIDWPSWRTFTAALGDGHLIMAGLRPGLWAIGHSTPTTAAVIQQDGMILADRADSPSLTVLRGWLIAWENSGRPAPETYTPRPHPRRRRLAPAAVSVGSPRRATGMFKLRGDGGGSLLGLDGEDVANGEKAGQAEELQR